MRAIQIAEHGGPDVLTLVESDDPVPGEGELLVQVAAAGVNFIDIYHREGLYPGPLPRILGVEGAGRVMAAGPGVLEPAIGDRVAWAQVPGSYATRVVVPAGDAVVVPEDLDDHIAAAVMLQGLTAHYLVESTFPLGANDTCLVHAAAGGVGRLLVQMAKAKGATVFATAGGDEKAASARAAGADHVIDYRRVSFRDAVEEIAGHRPFDVIYDGVGGPTFDDGLALLRPRGLMATFGNAAGPVDPVSPLVLSRNGSLFLTRPTLGDYIATRAELDARAAAVFGMCVAGDLDVQIHASYPLEGAALAQRELAGRTTSGKLLLVP